mmetsp:Transcript_34114/g.107541  ORF Transcript_34114/g.107541 Transcript_34114/m.107541 type:complete len:280 (-) Transcript_34114:74-913(-)
MFCRFSRGGRRRRGPLVRRCEAVLPGRPPRRLELVRPDDGVRGVHRRPRRHVDELVGRAHEGPEGQPRAVQVPLEPRGAQAAAGLADGQQPADLGREPLVHAHDILPRQQHRRDVAAVHDGYAAAEGRTPAVETVEGAHDLVETPAERPHHAHGDGRRAGLRRAAHRRRRRSDAAQRLVGVHDEVVGEAEALVHVVHVQVAVAEDGHAAALVEGCHVRPDRVQVALDGHGLQPPPQVGGALTLVAAQQVVHAVGSAVGKDDGAGAAQQRHERALIVRRV